MIRARIQVGRGNVNSSAWAALSKDKPLVAVGYVKDAGMNRLEAAYAGQLEARRQLREIQWWAFEAIKLRLADNTFYTPDFLVMGIGGELEVHETKGRSGDRYWCREDAKIKLKIAAENFPFRFKIVWPQKGTGWSEEDF